MLQINEDKEAKEQKSLFSSEVQSKIDPAQEKDRNTYEIIKLLFFLIAMLFIVMTLKIFLKSKRPIIKDTFLFFGNYNGIKNAKKLDLNFERNYYGINGYIYKDIIFNPLKLNT